MWITEISIRHVEHETIHFASKIKYHKSVFATELIYYTIQKSENRFLSMETLRYAKLTFLSAHKNTSSLHRSIVFTGDDL